MLQAVLPLGGQVSIDIKAERQLRPIEGSPDIKHQSVVSIDIKAERQLRLKHGVINVTPVHVSIDIKAERQLRLHRVLHGGQRVLLRVSIDIKAERQLRLAGHRTVQRTEFAQYQSTSKPKGNCVEATGDKRHVWCRLSYQSTSKPKGLRL